MEATAKLVPSIAVYLGVLFRDRSRSEHPVNEMRTTQ